MFIKLFGFSFTAVRLSTLVEAVATAFLLERSLVRAGLNQWNATLATMTFILSPLYLPLAFTFMTDVSGVLCLVLCLYMCLRALQAKSEGSAMIWISLAALVNAVGGTARQIAWLGVMVMVPSTLWLLRGNRRVLAAGAISVIAGLGIVFAAMRWFAEQPYSIPESPVPDIIDWESLRHLAEIGLCGAGQLALMALPVLLMFAGSLRSWVRRKAIVFGIGVLCFAVPGIALVYAGSRLLWLASFANGYMTHSTLHRLNAIAVQGTRLPIAGYGFVSLLAGATVLGILSLLASCSMSAHRHPVPQRNADTSSGQKLAIVLGPFSLAYIALSASVASRYVIFDRYLLPLLAILLLVLARFYQQSVKANLPMASVLLIAIFGGFSVAATHDDFALRRGYVSAIDQIRSSGAPATGILGPWEFDGWTEVEGRIRQ